MLTGHVVTMQPSIKQTEQLSNTNYLNITMSSISNNLKTQFSLLVLFYFSKVIVHPKMKVLSSFCHKLFQIFLLQNYFYVVYMYE